MRVRFGQFTLDTDRRQMLRGAEAMSIPPKALQLLELLIVNRPRAVSQQELYDALWPDTLVEKTNLHNLIYQLRVALEDDKHAVIRTAYGYGFSFAGTAVDVAAARFVAAWQLVIGDSEYDLREGENLIGRENDVAVRIDAPSMSRHHARIIVTGDGLMLEDLGSKNGTYLRGRRIHRVDQLRDGDDILFGTVAARVHSIHPASSTETSR